MRLSEYYITKHAQDMLDEREIPQSWLIECLENPDKTEWHDNETIHYLKAISEYENRFLRVVVNPFSQPKRIITFFFDRRIKVLI